MIGRLRIVKKGWGRELIFADVYNYAGKILEVKPGGLMSLHFHIIKHETWYVLDGEVEVVWIETDDGEPNQMTLRPGDVWTNEPGLPHRLKNVSEHTCRILEASTYDDPDDNYRVQPGDSQARPLSLPDGA